MELSNSLMLNEEALRQCPNPTKPVFVYEWLRYLDRILLATKKTDIKTCQQKLLEQLRARISSGLGPPSRILLARCISKVYAIADTYDLFETINICNDLIKAKEDSGSHLQVKLTALCVLGTMYEKLGRMVGRTYEESYQTILRWIKIADSNSRAEILVTLTKLVKGLGSAAHTIHKDLFKLLSKNYLTDRVMNVRASAVKCLAALVAEHDSPVYLNEIDSICTLCLKALDSSDYQVRREVANVFASLVIHGNRMQKNDQSLSTTSNTFKSNQSWNEFDVLSFMATSFLRGGFGGFLKSGKTFNGVISGGQKEIRIGIALAYIEVSHSLGMIWLEKNLQLWIQHLLDITKKFGALAYTNDAAQISEVIMMRRCISFIFRNTIGALLSEQFQIVACKHFGSFLIENSNCFDNTADVLDDRILSVDAYSSSEASIVALHEISSLVRQVGSSIRPLFVEASGIMEPVFASLLHPVNATRISAAWCLRCITLTVSSQCTPIIDRCLNRLEHMKKQSDVINGFSFALAALLAGSRDSELGIPFCKSRQVFAFAEEMIKTATQSPKYANKRIAAGWLLMSSVISVGSAFIRPHMGQLLMLWKHAFPRSVDEAKAEKSRGDAFTWECTLESRAGALTSMDMFLRYCSELVTDEYIRKIVVFIETCLTTMALVTDLLLNHGIKLRFSLYILRIRLYSLLVKHIPLKYFDNFLSPLLRELVADITITDNAQVATTNSLVSDICLTMESSLLGGWIKNTAQSYLELSCHPQQSIGIGALDYDAMQLVYGEMSALMHDTNFLWPEPLPSNIQSIDCAILLFSKVFPMLPTKRKLQLVNHFLKGLKNLKPSSRLNAIQLNVLTSLCLTMKTISETPKSVKINDEELQRNIINLILPHINSERVLLKCLAIETLGRVAQSVAEPQFVAGNAQYCFDKLRSIRDEKSRTGYALSLGALHRYMGSLGSGQHLNTSVSVILALAQDNTSSTVQSWSILSLSLIASTGGGMFRGYVEPSLSLCLRLLLSTTPTHVDVIIAVAKLTSALITSVGPELLTTLGTIEHTRTSFLIACSMMYENSDPQVKAEAIFCWQQLHLFAPRFVQLDSLVINICELLYSPHLILRKSAICCLRQLLQREAKEVREHAQTLVPMGLMDQSSRNMLSLPETGLEGALFELLDTETDREMRQHIKECILFLMHATCGESLNFWLSTCKDIIASSSNQDCIRSTIFVDESKHSKNVSASASSHQSGGNSTKTESAPEVEGHSEDDDTLHVRDFMHVREKVIPRWQTRVFGFEVVQKLMAACENERAHLDLALAKELQLSNGENADYLVLHLSDLVRMAFIGATSENCSLRLAGLRCLQDVIIRFSTVPEPEFPGHVILEQFQAQVGAALRPAFEPDTPSSITAAACEVCSTWIGSGVARDLNDLRRVHQLLVSSLTKLHHGSINTQLYNESAATLEKLSILKAWAEVYIVAVQQTDKNQKLSNEDPEKYQESLLNLVNPELNILIGYWLASLRDSALLCLPQEFESQLLENVGAFYVADSAESCKEYYRSCWPSILLATSIWLKRNNFDTKIANNCDVLKKWSNNSSESRFHLLMGVCIEYLCNTRQYSDSNDRTIQLSLNTIKNLLDCEWSQYELMKDSNQAIEIMNVLHRLILIRDSLHIQRLCIEVMTKIFDAAELSINYSCNNENEVANAEVDSNRNNYCGYKGNEGDGSNFNPHTSLSFTILEVCLCLLVRQIPQIYSTLLKKGSITPLHFRNYLRLSAENAELIQQTVQLLVRVPCLCSPSGTIIILPSILHMILGVLRETSRQDSASSTPNDQFILVSDLTPGRTNVAVTAAIIALKSISSSFFKYLNDDPTVENEKICSAFESILRSALLSLLNMINDDCNVDKGIVMLAITVMVTSGPPTLVCGTTLFFSLCNLCRDCLISDSNFEVQIRTLQSINSIFSNQDIRCAFIKELGGAVFSKIQHYVIENFDNDTIENKQCNQIKSEIELPTLEKLSDSEVILIQETIKTMESMTRHSKGEKERLFVNLLVRSLCRFLCADPLNNLKNCHPNVRAIHYFAFRHINTAGLNHSNAFKAIINACPDIRRRIEDAAQYAAHSQIHKTNAQNSENKKLRSTKTDDIARPSIKLNMDFSFFK